MTKQENLTRLALEGIALLQERGFYDKPRPRRGAAFAINSEKDALNKAKNVMADAKIARLVEAVHKDHPELSCDELIAEIVRRDPTLKPVGAAAYQQFAKQVKEACKAAGLKLTDDDDLTREMLARAADYGPNVTMSLAGRTAPTAARIKAVVDEQMANARRTAPRR